MPGGALMSGGVEMLCTQRVPRSKAPEATGGAQQSLVQSIS